MRLLPLTGRVGRGKFTLLDDEDFERAVSQRWSYNHRQPSNTKLPSRQRAVHFSPGRFELLHRSVLTWAGHDLEGLDIVHRNGWGLDNRRENLCTGSRRFNRCTGRHSNIHQTHGGWRAMFGRQSLGVFPSQEAAELAYEGAINSLGCLSVRQQAQLAVPLLGLLEGLAESGQLVRLLTHSKAIEDRYRLP